MNLLRKLFGKSSDAESGPPQPHQHDIAQTGIVSIWIGDFTTEDEMMEYIFESFSKDFGFTLNERSLPECGTEEEKKKIRELLTGFSRYNDFIDEAVSMIESAGIHEASCAAVLYAADYSLLNKINLPTEPLRFVGTCSFGREDADPVGVRQ